MLINNTFISLLMDDHHHFSYITKYEEPLSLEPNGKMVPSSIPYHYGTSSIHYTIHHPSPPSLPNQFKI
jgi:hypothetical protein